MKHIGRVLQARARRWGWLFGVALASRLAYWFLVTPKWRSDGDADQYLRLARSLARGHGFGLVYPQLVHHPTAFRPPLYPFILTPGALVFGDAVWPARLVTAIVGASVAVLAAVLASRIAGPRAGLVAGLLVAVYPPLLANDTITLTEPLALLLLLTAVLLADDDRWAWAGGVLGLSLLTRPNGYGLVAVIAVWVGLRLGWRRGLGVAGVAVCVFVPWIIRNRVQVTTWEPYTSQGFTLAAVYSEPAQGAGFFIDPSADDAFGDLRHRVAQFDEAGWNSMLTRDALTGIRDHPGYVWHTIRQNFRGYFEITPSLNRYPERNDGRNRDFRAATLPAFYLVTLAGIAGLIRWRRDARTIVLGLVGAQFVVISLVLVAPPRLRAPVDVICCIGVGLLVAPRRPARREQGSHATDVVLQPSG